jgi:galactose mutarotase-like enzyme
MEYVLKNEQLTVKFQSKGGALSSVRDQDQVEYLWQGDPEYWSGQAPVLFPICGSIRNDEAETATGKKLGMPRHGLVRKKEFTCESQTDNEITFAIENDEEMLEHFPYPFQLKIQYTLKENKITTKYIVSNKGSEDMPFFIGGHPGFNCPLLDSEKYEDYRIEFEQEETCTVPTPVTETGLIDMEHRTPYLNQQKELPLTHEMFKEDAVILDQLRSRSVSLKSGNHEKGVTLNFEEFPYLILWSTANDGPFIALEPWIGLSTCSDENDIFEEKRNVQTVAPGEEQAYQFEIVIS